MIGMDVSNSTPATASSELPSEIWRWDATDIAAHIRLRTIASSDAVQSCLDRIAEVNPHPNAIVHMVANNALREAKEADVALKNNASIGPLHGVPVTIKLNVDVRGEATTNGVAANRNLIAPEDSAVVANLRKAGAIILGRTNTPPFCHRWFTENPLHGRTLNPWNDDVTPGGSSGGAAVSVAAGMCPLAHSTDIAGSTRYPAYAWGVVGLRTTPGRVPAYSPTVGARLFAPQTMSAQGPIARTIRDAYLGLAAMSPRDTRDPMWVDARLDYPDDGVPVRVALIEGVENVIIAPEVKAALIQAAKWLAEAGYEIESVRSPSLHAAAELWLFIARTEAETEHVCGRGCYQGSDNFFLGARFSVFCTSIRRDWIRQCAQTARCHASGAEHVPEPIPAHPHADFVPTSIPLGRGFARSGTREALGW
jgi:amidase